MGGATPVGPPHAAADAPLRLAPAPPRGAPTPTRAPARYLAPKRRQAECPSGQFRRGSAPERRARVGAVRGGRGAGDLLRPQPVPLTSAREASEAGHGCLVSCMRDACREKGHGCLVSCMRDACREKGHGCLVSCMRDVCREEGHGCLVSCMRDVCREEGHGCLVSCIRDACRGAPARSARRGGRRRARGGLAAVGPAPRGAPTGCSPSRPPAYR